MPNVKFLVKHMDKNVSCDSQIESDCKKCIDPHKSKEFLYREHVQTKGVCAFLFYKKQPSGLFSRQGFVKLVVTFSNH